MALTLKRKVAELEAVSREKGSVHDMALFNAFDRKNEEEEFQKKYEICAKFYYKIKAREERKDQVANEWFNHCHTFYEQFVYQTGKIPTVEQVIDNLEEKLYYNKGECLFFQKTIKKWMERIYTYVFAPPWNENTVCSVCGITDDRNMMECSMQIEKQVNGKSVPGVCENWAHPACCKYPPDYKWSSYVHTERLEEYFACLTCKNLYGGFPPPRDSDDGREQEKIQDEEVIAVLLNKYICEEARQIRLEERTKFDDDKNLLKYALDTRLKPQDMPLLLTNGESSSVMEGALEVVAGKKAGQPSLMEIMEETLEVVPGKKAGQLMHRPKWTFEQWYKTIKKYHKHSDVYPWKTLGMNKMSSADDVQNWCRAFSKKFHPDKYRGMDDAKANDMMGMFNNARDIMLAYIEKKEQKLDAELKESDEKIQKERNENDSWFDLEELEPESTEQPQSTKNPPEDQGQAQAAGAK